MKRTTKKNGEKFNRLVAEYLDSLPCARRVKDDDPRTKWEVDTDGLGRLLVTLPGSASEYGYTIFGRFLDPRTDDVKPERWTPGCNYRPFKQQWRELDANPCSGKWNFHYPSDNSPEWTIGHFKDIFRCVLPVEVRAVA